MEGTALQTSTQGKRLHDDSLKRDEERAGKSCTEWVRLALPISLVRQLMENRHLCIADVRCLDVQSKAQLHRLCLECCTRCLSRPAVPGIDTPGVAQPSTTARTSPREASSGCQVCPSRSIVDNENPY